MPTVQNCMIARAVVLPADATVGDAVARMRAEAVGRLCVVDHDRLVGIVTRSDLMGVLPSTPTADAAEAQAFWMTPVTAVMTPRPIVVGPATSVATAARLLQRHRIQALPVVDRGALVGIITTQDIVDALGHHVGSDIRGAQMSVALPNDLADLHRLTDALVALKDVLFPLALTVRLSKHERLARLIVGTAEPLRVAEELAAAGFKVSGLRADPGASA